MTTRAVVSKQGIKCGWAQPYRWDEELIDPRGTLSRAAAPSKEPADVVGHLIRMPPDSLSLEVFPGVTNWEETLGLAQNLLEGLNI